MDGRFREGEGGEKTGKRSHRQGRKTLEEGRDRQERKKRRNLTSESGRFWRQDDTILSTGFFYRLVVEKIQMPLWTVAETIDFLWTQILLNYPDAKEDKISKYREIIIKKIFLHIKLGDLHLVDQVEFKHVFIQRFFYSILSHPFEFRFKDKNMLARKVVPYEALKFFKKKGYLDLPDEIWVAGIGTKLPDHATGVVIGDDLEKYMEFIQGIIDTRDATNPGAKALFEKRDRFVGQGAYYMQKLLDIGCLCRHDKLAKIAFRFGTIPTGEKISDLGAQVKDRKFDPLEALKRKASEMVPPERYYSNSNKLYDSTKCVCDIPDHKAFRR